MKMDILKNNLAQNSLVLLIIIFCLYILKLNIYLSTLMWIFFLFFSWNIIKCYEYYLNESFISPKGKAVIVTGNY